MSNETNLSELSKIAFADEGELIAAMSDPRYSSPYSSAWREMVAARLAISEGIGTDSTYTGKQSNAVSIGTGPMHEQADPAPSEDATVTTLMGGAQRVTQPQGTISQNERDRGELDRLLGQKELLTEAIEQEKKAQGVE